METRVKKLEDFVATEENGQRWRRLTPVTVVSQLFVSIGGFGMLAWFAIYVVNNFDKQIDVEHQEINTIHQEMQEGRERRDLQLEGVSSRIDCVAENVRGCCKNAINC